MLPVRKNIRIPEYDYALPGGYFVTIVTHKRETLFGAILNERMVLNEIGQMVKNVWLDLPHRFSCIQLDEYIVMPNHFHGILFIIEQNVGAGLVPARGKNIDSSADLPNKENLNTGDHKGRPYKIRPSLSAIIGVFKSITTNNYIDKVINSNWPKFSEHIWQRGYYDRVIRNENELNSLREYIHYNPLSWKNDDENPYIQ